MVIFGKRTGDIKWAIAEIPGLLISILTSDSNIIKDTFGVLLSVSEVLLWRNIAIGIGDCFFYIVSVLIIGKISTEYR